MTTDHISPAGAIRPDSPAGRYLVEHGVERKDFNSYGSRRGNHEVMVRGTFANVRLRNLLVPGSEGTWTVHVPSGEEMTIFEASTRYLAEGTPLIVIAGKEYGTGSSRDWAAKGPKLLGVRAVIAETYERIHRSNLLMMGILPLQFMPGENAESLGLTGREEFSITGIENGEAREVTVRADDKEFRARVRLDTPREREYLRHGGILPFVLRRLLHSRPGTVPRACPERTCLGTVPSGDNRRDGDGAGRNARAAARARRGGHRAQLGALARRAAAEARRDGRRADRRAVRGARRHRPRRGRGLERFVTTGIDEATRRDDRRPAARPRHPRRARSATRRRCGCTTSPTTRARSASRRTIRR